MLGSKMKMQGTVEALGVPGSVKADGYLAISSDLAQPFLQGGG